MFDNSILVTGARALLRGTTHRLETSSNYQRKSLSTTAQRTIKF